MSSNNKDLSSPIPLGQHNSASPSTKRKRTTRLAYAPKPIEATSRGQLKDDGSDAGEGGDPNWNSSEDDDSDDDHDDDEQPKKKQKKTGK